MSWRPILSGRVDVLHGHQCRLLRRSWLNICLPSVVPIWTILYGGRFSVYVVSDQQLRAFARLYVLHHMSFQILRSAGLVGVLPFPHRPANFPAVQAAVATADKTAIFPSEPTANITTD
jgi:hypothetical protein